MMKRHTQWYMPFLLLLLALSLQSCFGLGGTQSDFQKKSSGSTQIGINQTKQAAFQGKIYFTLNRNLNLLDSNGSIRALSHTADVRDPAVSPDGKWIAFAWFHPNYSDLVLMSAQDGSTHTLLSGNGQFVSNPGYAPMATYHWFAQPSWAPDSKHLLFISDLKKDTSPGPGINAFLLDLQVFSISIDNPNATLQPVAYANFGDGGDQSPSYRPHHPDQVIYTHFAYDTSGTKQIDQIYLEDANAIANHPGMYRPGVTGYEFDPAVALTPATPDLVNMQPAFSPDGNSIAYVRRLSATQMSIYIMPIPENVTQNPNDPAVEKKALQPFSHSSLIVTGQYVSQPIWSPDGKQLAYIGYNNNIFDIWLITLQQDPQSGKYSTKGAPVQLTDTGGNLDADSRPFWTP
jgi:Tol biopolymer transport system component